MKPIEPETHEHSTLEDELGHALFQISRARMLHFPMKQHPARHGDLLFLQVLGRLETEFPDGVRASELSTRMNVTKGAITHVLNHLEALGFIERVADENDRRVVLVQLTQKGRDLDVNRRAFVKKEMGQLVKFLGEEDTQELIRLLNRLNEYYQDRCERGFRPGFPES
jgi:DNA-binding MarR family transcriptional regulator